MKRILLASVILSVFAASLFAGGGKQDSSKQGSGGGPMKISWVGWWSPAEKGGDIIKVIEEKFNVVIEPWQQEGLDVRLAAGEIPDLFWVGTGNYPKYVQDKVVAELPWATVQQYAPNLYKAYLDDAGEYYVRQTEVNGKNYGLDVLDAETGGFRQLIVYRGDWIEKVGGKVPETLAEFEDLMYKFAQNDPDGNGKKDTYGLSSWMLQAVYGAYGYLPESIFLDSAGLPGAWTVKNGQKVYGAIQPEMKEALALLAKWYKDGVLHPEFITGESTGGNQNVSNQFVNGQIGVTACDYLYFKPAQLEGEREGANITELKAINPTAAQKLVYGNPPVGPAGKRGVYQGSPLHTGFIVMGAQVADQPEKLAKILEILQYSISDYNGFLLTRFGVEGKHWSMGGNGFPVGIGNFSEWGQITRLGGGAYFNVGSWLKPIVAKVNAEYAWGVSMPELQQYGIRDAQFKPLPSLVEYGVELRKIQEEAYTDIITGRQPVSYFDTFVQQWKAAGGDILTKEANQQ